MYSVVWKYVVEKKNQPKFEKEYGDHGTWTKLFRNSKNYVGSFLKKSIEINDTYLLTDTWTEKKQYEIFKKENQKIYEELSSEFEILYKKAEKIGEFKSVN